MSGSRLVVSLVLVAGLAVTGIPNVVDADDDGLWTAVAVAGEAVSVDQRVSPLTEFRRTEVGEDGTMRTTVSAEPMNFESAAEGVGADRCEVGAGEVRERLEQGR